MQQSKKNCIECHKELGESSRYTLISFCRPCSKKGSRNGMFGKEGNIKDKAWNWAENPSYRALHKRIEKDLGKPNVCANCEDDTKSKYQWANFSREYKQDLDDWIRLCVKCHEIFDNNDPYLNRLKVRGW